MRTARALGTASALLSAILLVSGCSDEPNRPVSTGGTLQGAVTRITDGSPVVGVKLVLANYTTLRPSAPAALSNSAGLYRITGIAPGRYALFVYHDSLVVYDRTVALIDIEGDTVATQDMRLIDAEIWNGRGYRIAGRVTDASSGHPLEGAYVGMVGWEGTDLSGLFLGIGLPEWGVTDAQGRFSIASIHFRTEYEGGGLMPITVTHAGYEPFTLVGTGPMFLEWGPLLPLPETPDSVLEVEIAMRRLGANGAGPHGAGALRGRVVHLGQPLAGLRVGISAEQLVDADTLAPRGKFRAAVPVPDRGTVTDVEGRFFIDELTPGSYGLQPAYLPEDGYVAIHLPAVGIIASDTTDVGDLEVARAIAIISPAQGSVIDDATPEFRWEATPLPSGYHLVEYEIQIAVGQYLVGIVEDGLTEPSWQVPEDQAFPPGACVRWFVQARVAPDAGGNWLDAGDSEKANTFCVAP